MASYRLLVTASAAKEIDALPKADRRRSVARIASLTHDPRPPGCEKLSGRDQYRLRQGDYKILYQIQDLDVCVGVVRVGHRRDVYR